MSSAGALAPGSCPKLYDNATLLSRIASAYEWRCFFLTCSDAEERGTNHDAVMRGPPPFAVPSAAPPHSSVSVQRFCATDVAAVLVLDEEVECEDCNHWLVGRLHDGRWFSLSCLLCSSGWDYDSCDREARAFVAHNWAELEAGALTPAQRSAIFSRAWLMAGHASK